ncbi:MAG: hypothetical protein V4510_09000 [bacterium]
MAILAVLACCLPVSTGQVPSPDTVGKTLHPILDPVVAQVLPPAEVASGEDLHGEDIAAVLDLDIRNVDDDVVGIVFGGGKVGADAVATFHLDFRAVGADRLDEAIRSGTGDANASLRNSFGVPANRTALTAEEVRLVGAGELLALFQAYELGAAKRYLEASLPGLTVLDLSGAWSNTLPASGLRSGHLPGVPDPNNPYATVGQPPIPPLREPPLVLDARARLQYLDRFSLVGILQRPDRPDTERDRLQARIEHAQSDAVTDRSAFRLLGLKQLLDVQVPPGWRLAVTMTVPQGFTIEGATDEIIVSSDHRSATYHASGDGRTTAVSQAAVVTVSNRYIVTITVLAVALLAGYVLRLPIEMAGLRIAYALQRGTVVRGPSAAERLRRRLPFTAIRPRP